MAHSAGLQRFLDFFVATREAKASGPDEMIVDASQFRTHLFPLMLRGLSSEMVFQGGTKIKDAALFNYTETFQQFNFDDTHSFTASDDMTEVEVPWRAAKVHCVLSEPELDLNQGGEREVFLRLKRKKVAKMDLDWWEGMEKAIWAIPEVATMESATNGRGKALSLRCFITDDGLAPSSTNGGATGGNWSTVMTANPTTYTNWRNQVATFDNTNSTTREATFINGMDNLWLSCQYMSPESSEQLQKSTTLQKMRILMNKTTMLLLIKLATAANNVLTPRNDIGWAAGQVVYHGLPTHYIGYLDNSGQDSTNYRLRFVNFNYIKPIFHKKHYRTPRTLDAGAQQPYDSVIFEDTWWNLWCSSRRNQGILVPA